MSDADTPSGRPVLLSEFLARHRDAILEDWARQVLEVFQSKGVGYSSSRQVLRDGMAHFLEFLLDHVDRGVEVAERQHITDSGSATGREPAFSLRDVFQVQTQLRGVVGDLLEEEYGSQPKALGELTGQLERAINETTLETASLYYQMSEYEIKESRRETQRVAAICRMTTAIISSLDPGEICRAAAKELPDLFPFRHLRLALLAEDGVSFRQYRASPGGTAETDAQHIELADSSSYQWVLQTRKPHLVKDLAVHARFFDDREDHDSGMRSRIVMPIIARAAPLGVMDLVHAEPESYTERDVPVMWQIASQLGVTLDCMHLMAAERKRATQLRIVNKVAKALGEVGLEALLKLAAESIRDSFSFYDVSIFLLSDDGRELVLTAQSGAYRELAEQGYRQALDVGMVGWTARTGEVLLANDVSKEPRRILAFGGETTVGAEMCVPILVGDQVAGVINVESTEVDAFDAEDVRAIETISEEIGTALEWTRLRAQHQEVERQAADARRQLDYIGRSTSLGIAATDMQGVYTHWGPGSERLTGHAAQEVVIAKRPSDLIVSDFDLEAALARCIAEGQASDEVMLAKQGGGHVWVRQVWVPLQDDEGRQLGFVCYMHDVTERRQAEAALRQEKMKLDNVVDMMGAGLCTIDPDRHITWVNRTLVEWLEADQESLIGSVCCSAFRPGEARCKPCAFEMVHKTGQPFKVEHVHVSPSGVTRHLAHVYAPLPDEGGGMTHVIKLSQDVTGNALRVQQMSLLRELGQEMQGTLDLDRLLFLILTCVTAGHEGLGFNRALLFLIDPEAKTLKGRMAVGPADESDAVRAWREIEEKGLSLRDLASGDSRARQAGSPLNQLVMDTQFPLDAEGNCLLDCVRTRQPAMIRSAEEAGPDTEAFAHQLGSREFVCVPLVATDKPLGVVVADNRFNERPIEEADVQLLSMFATQAGLAVDTAAAYRKLADQMRQLDEAQESLVRAERLAVIGELAAHVAHEIRNPLVTIGGFARSLLRHENLPERVQRGATIIVEEVERLERILRGVMDFSKPAQPQKEPVHLNTLVANVADGMRGLASAGGLSIELDLAPDLGEVPIDTDQIRQVFINIIKNAIEAEAELREDTPPDQRPPAEPIRVATTRDDIFARVSVTDRGPGMSPQVLENIFNPFYTLKVSGTGLGLAVTHRIVSDHAGDITVESQEGVGTTFTVLLPLIDVQPAAAS